MTDEVVIRKLIADGNGTSEDKKILQLISLIEALGVSEDLDLILDSISIVLDQVELSIKKQCLTATALQEDTKNNEELFVKIDTCLEHEERRMKLVKQELADAQKVLQNRQEYDAIAKRIKEKPSRADSDKAIRRLQADLNMDLERQKLFEQMLIDKRNVTQSLLDVLDHFVDDSDVTTTIVIDSED